MRRTGRRLDPASAQARGRALAARAIAGEATPPRPTRVADEPRERTPTAGPRLRGRPARDMQTRFAPSFVVVCLLLAIGIVVSLVLWATIRPDDPQPPTTTTAAAAGAAAAATTIAGAATAAAGQQLHDPDRHPDVVRPARRRRQRRGERDLVDDARADGDPATNWTTECYSDEYMGKAGVGVVVTLSAPASRRGQLRRRIGAVRRRRVRHDRRTDPGADRSVGAARRIASSATPRRRTPSTIPTAARHVLVLFRQAGHAPTCNSGVPYQAVLGELAFTAG